jgi:hypothetical protein
MGVYVCASGTFGDIAKLEVCYRFEAHIPRSPENLHSCSTNTCVFNSDQSV